VKDGDRLNEHDEIALVRGPHVIFSLASAWRSIFSSASAASRPLTRKYVDAVAVRTANILDTRKTRPAFARWKRWPLRRAAQ